MAWSITLLRIAGSEIRIHVTFLLLLAWIGFSQYVTSGTSAAVDAVAFVVAVFACVLLHELGHVFAARRYGITTPHITLLPIGGLAALSSIPENPREEIVIALAGPAVNVVIAIVLLVGLGFSVDPAAFAALENPAPGFLARLAAVNVYLVLFNLIPAFPMDGGRVLRALLAIRLGRRRATEIAAQIGQAVAFGFGLLGLFSGNPLLVFVAIFVYLAASAEAGETGLADIAKRLPVDRAIVRSFESLGTQATVGEAAEALIRTTQHEFPVVDGGGRLRGFVTRESMIAALRSGGAGTPVLEAMVAAPSVTAGAMLSAAIERMREAGVPVAGVTGPDGRLIGYVSQENLAELMMLEAVAFEPGPGRSGGTAGGVPLTRS